MRVSVTRIVLWLGLAALVAACESPKSQKDKPEPARLGPGYEHSVADDEPYVCPKDEVVFCEQRFALDETSVSCQNPAVTNLRPLACLTQLSSIFLTDLQATDLAPLASLKELSAVTLFSMKVSNLSPIRNAKLERLELVHIDIDNIAMLADFSELWSLTLSHIKVDDISALATLKKLRFVSLSDVPVRDLRPLADHPKLRLLSLMTMELPDLSPISGLPIDVLTLDDSRVGELAAVVLPNLRKLNVNGMYAPEGHLDIFRERHREAAIEGEPKLDAGGAMAAPRRKYD